VNKSVLCLPFVLCVAGCGSTAVSTSSSAPTPAGSPVAQGGPYVWPDEGPRTWAPRPTEAAITANDLRTRLYQFADDSMQGRRIGDPGNYKGTAYIESEFRRLGLKPGGDNGTYFQNLPYGPIALDVASARVSAGGAPLTARTDWMPISPGAAGGTGTADLSGVATVFAGRWGDTTVALDANALRGKVAVFLASPSAIGAGAGAGRGGRGNGAVVRCDSLPDQFGAAAAAASEAAAGGRGGRGGAGGRGGGRGGAAADPRAQQAGAAGILLVTLDSLPPPTVAAEFTSRAGMQPAAASGPVVAAISSAAAAKIFGRPASQLSVGATGQPITAHWAYEWHMSATPARNVIAILPGSDPARASEYVLVGAHNDHVGVNAVGVDHDSLRAVNTVTRKQGANDPVCRPTPQQQHLIDSMIARARSIRPPRRDSIMNGADDDGSGTVILLEVAEKFVTEKPARSIIFVSHEGEESGLLGSRWFTDHPTIPLDKIAAALNMDMEAKGHVEQVKFGGPSSIQTLGSRRLSREFGDIIDSVNATRGEVMAIDKTWDVTANPMNRFCRSDQVNYVHHDVPVTYFSTGYAQDYHQPTDEPEYADYDHMARIGRFIHDIMWAISVRKDRPAIAGPDPSYPQCR
jgi:peptidase M28-like protein